MAKKYTFFEEPTEEPTVVPTGQGKVETLPGKGSGEPTVGTTNESNKPHGPTTKALKEDLDALQSQLALFNDRLTALEQKPSPSQPVPAPAPAISDGMKQDFATAIRTWLSATKPINTKTGKPNPAHDSPEINEKRARMVNLLVQVTGGTLTEVLKKTKLAEWWTMNVVKPEA
jgi:hypothetical protein